LLGQPVVDTLDLHGRTAPEAERLVRDFILTSTRSASGRVVRIVTGKGIGSAGKPVLLPLVRHWLETDVARYVDAMSLDTGGGAGRAGPGARGPGRSNTGSRACGTSQVTARLRSRR
jgi:DNA-nicking Smr family endonuclease